MGKFATELRGPLRHGLKRDIDPALGEQVLDVPQAQWEPMIEPYCVSDDLGRKEMALVTVCTNVGGGLCMEHAYNSDRHQSVKATPRLPRLTNEFDINDFFHPYVVISAFGWSGIPSKATLRVLGPEPTAHRRDDALFKVGDPVSNSFNAIHNPFEPAVS